MPSSASTVLGATWRGLIDLLLPPRCAGCATPLADDQRRSVSVDRAAASRVLCGRCLNELELLPRRACVLCQRALGPGAGEEDRLRCGGCASRSSALEACVAGVVYRGEVETWIHRFKYPAPGLSALDPGAGAIAKALIRDASTRLTPESPELVIPVPLHPRRLRDRGFNPAGLLAREVAVITRAHFVPRLIERSRDTPSQTGLQRPARVRNVAGAFRCPYPVTGRVWLVDDVVTTGSTVSEAARCLRRAGAQSVIALAAARTPLDSLPRGPAPQPGWTRSAPSV